MTRAIKDIVLAKEMEVLKGHVETTGKLILTGNDIPAQNFLETICHDAQRISRILSVEEEGEAESKEEPVK